MEIVEIAELYKHIKKHYPFFDASLAKVKEDHLYLRDFPAAVARENINRHILTETITPNIAHIRGRLGEQLERQKAREETEAYFAQVELWRNNGNPPPVGYWEAAKARVRGGGA